MRKCSKETTYRKELIGNTSIVRELHVYGSVVPVSERNLNKYQHQGYGVLLMENAERIAIKEHKSDKMAVISGVGTRQYYRKLGYHLEGPYMVKSLKSPDYKSVFDWVDENHPVCAPFALRPENLVHFETHEEYLDKYYKSLGIKRWVDDFCILRTNSYLFSFRFDVEAFLNS